MNLFPGQLALLNLQGGIEEDERGFMTKEAALARLQELSGLSLGADLVAWEAWVLERYANVDRVRTRELTGNKDQ